MNRERGDILAVIGAQYGSEGKGNLVAHIANDYDVHVRVGGPNAGHSFCHEGQLWKMQTIPCGWVNPKALLVIGRGALISLEQLEKEWRELRDVGFDVTHRMKIDAGAGIISSAHHREAGGVHGEAHQRYGSTGEGVGVARIARIQRRPDNFQHFGDVVGDSKAESDFAEFLTHAYDEDTPGMIAGAAARGTDVLLEGTQGAGLSLIHGPWPYTTNHDTNSAQLAADCGLPPRIVNRCLLVMRTLPIRVAGNSGPMERELTWEQVSERAGRPVTEQTTVTKKTRRVGEWDETLIDEAVKLNAPTSLAINFLDYIAPEVAGVTKLADISDKSAAFSFMEYVERMWKAPVLLAGTGGPAFSVIDLRRDWTRL